jgi:hypothetical protein
MVGAVLKKKERIITKIKTCYLRRDQKFGIQIPNIVAGALCIDEETGTTYWGDAIRKEMGGNIIPEQVSNHQLGLKKSLAPTCLMQKWTLPERLGLWQGHVTEPPSSQTYTSVVSRDSVCIAFLLAALNDLGIMCAEQGAYLNAPCHEHANTVCGDEFGR